MTPDGLQVEWVARTPAFVRWLREHPTLALTRLVAGEEAEIEALAPPGSQGAPSFVLKRWRAGFPADAKAQYAFLMRASRAALPVAAPAGWGWTPDRRQVLVTAYVGAPIACPTEPQLRQFADLLLRIHATPLTAVGLGGGGAPSGLHVERILGAYFPGLAKHPDIQAICAEFGQRIDAIEPALIHGDFNLGNILIQDGTLTVVDWTNVGASDRRYDLAWATVVLWIYSGAAAAAVFQSQYLSASPSSIDVQVLRYFEALAGLRWLLLHRQFPLSAGLNSVQSIAWLVDDRLPDACRGRLLELPGLDIVRPLDVR